MSHVSVTAGPTGVQGGMRMRRDYKNNLKPPRTGAPDPTVRSHSSPAGGAVGSYLYNPEGSIMSKEGGGWGAGGQAVTSVGVGESTCGDCGHNRGAC